MSIFTKSFSALQRAENSQWHVVPAGDHLEDEVSVLFSEPKILNPALRCCVDAAAVRFQCSSASRKFSIYCRMSAALLRCRFQCSSASRKFSIRRHRGLAARRTLFQCSSASRKFSIARANDVYRLVQPFQCSSASRKFSIDVSAQHQFCVRCVSVLFSEPKILNR